MFENLTSKIEETFEKIRGKSRLSENNISESLKEIRRALVNADVNYKISKHFVDSVKEKAVGQKITLSVTPGQMFTKIVRDELEALMGSKNVDISLKGNPNIVMVCGLQGSGKTTLCSKLALHLQKEHKRKPLLVACDIYRPAAIEQLNVLGASLGVEVFSDEASQDVKSISAKAKKYAISNGFDSIIIDTAGRLAIDEKMMDEISGLKKTMKPSEILFVADAMTGQDAVNTASEFNKHLDFDGVVLTKMDGDARGGAALSVKHELGKPIKFIGNGEKPENLEVFHPDRMADRIMGMGDVLTLVEKAQEQFDEKEAKKLEKKFKKNQFDYDDMLKQIGQVQKMGSVKDIMGMLPGVGSKMKDVDVDENQLKVTQSIIQSMTPKERGCKQDINHSRKLRIASGSGRRIEDVNRLIKQHKEMKKFMKLANQGRINLGGMMSNVKNMRKGI